VKGDASKDVGRVLPFRPRPLAKYEDADGDTCGELSTAMVSTDRFTASMAGAVWQRTRSATKGCPAIDLTVRGRPCGFHRV